MEGNDSLEFPLGVVLCCGGRSWDGGWGKVEGLC